MDMIAKSAIGEAILIIIERTKREIPQQSSLCAWKFGRERICCSDSFLLFGRDSSRAYQSKQGPNAKISSSDSSPLVDGTIFGHACSSDLFRW